MLFRGCFSDSLDDSRALGGWLTGQVCSSHHAPVLFLVMLTLFSASHALTVSTHEGLLCLFGALTHVLLNASFCLLNI